MKSVFISTKLRNTDNVDWATALKNYLARIYGSFTDFTNEVKIINKLRLDLNASTNDSSNRSFLKDLYYKYYGQLELLDLRLPVQEDGVRVKFRWYDAYDPSTHHTQYSLAFEKASILFNLASLLSTIASDDFENGDFKSSYQFFQYSAGIYKFIGENFLHAPSQDLDGKTVAFLQNLQLSQAQEVFLLKLISEDSSKKSLIAKLTMSTSIHYEQTLSAFEKLENEFGEEYKWTNNLKFKTSFYQNIAYLNYSLSIEEKKIGEAIAFLKLALTGFDSLKKIDNQTNIDYKTYQSQTEEKLKSLSRDNDFIYHDLIPSKDSLEPAVIIKPLDAAKAISLNDHANITEIVGEDIFEKVIPMAVHEKLSLYSEEKAKILRGEIEKNETADTELSSFLEYLNLPSSLDNFKNNVKNKLDPKLVGWSNEVNDSQYKDIEANKSLISDKKSIVLSTIKELEAKLQDEENDYNQKKPQIGTSQEPSQSASINLRDELTNAKQSLLSATKLDQQLNHTIEGETTRLNQLKSTQQLEAVFFSNNQQEQNLLDIDDSSNDQISKHITRIETSLKLLNNLKLERSKIIEDLKTVIHEDDISNILVLNNKKLSGKDEKALFDQELTKFEPYTNRLDSIIFKQPQIIKEIKISYDEILSSNSQISEKTLKTKEFEKTYKSFREYETNFQKSVTFYDNLINFVNDVKSNIEQFVSDRYSQRDRIINSSRPPQPNDALRDRFNKLSIGSNQSPRSSYSHEVPSQPPRQPSFGDAPLQPVRQQSYNSSISSHHAYDQPTPSNSYYQSSPQLPPKPQQPQQQYQYTQPTPPQYSQPTPQQYGYTAPPSGYSDRSAPPPLPPKFEQQQQPHHSGPPSGLSSLQPQPSDNSNRVPFYNTPSAFDQSMYKTFGAPTQQPPQQPPRYSYPYDPNKPYQ
ncbi:unnamed protein product [Wickerhamomyces anomalus]